jgi:hypothetical protein
MKKVLLTIGIILVALSVMAPEDKAEKLRHEDNGWEKEGQQFVVQMSCKFGIATAGEHANFTTRTELTIVAGGETYELESIENIKKVDGAEKDSDGYVKIEPSEIKWDSGDFEGPATVTSSTSLVSPSGNEQGDAVVSPPKTVEVMWPSTPVTIDENGWEYDPVEPDEIIVPLLAHPDKVDFLIKEGYQVTVYVDVSGEFLEGFGKGSAAIVKHDDQGWDYVQIQPVLADATVDWNGDDDGTGIVSGSIELVRPDGSVRSTTPFGPQTVWIVKHNPPPEH